MTPRPLTIAFHIGAHKTATSHLQRSLKHARRALADNGVRYYGPLHFRQPGQSIQALFGFRPGIDGGGARRSAADQLAVLRQDGHRLVFSEENFIGPLNQPHGRSMRHRYKAADSRLNNLSEAVGQQIEVFLAIRRPTAFINSAYCQMLLGGRIQSVETFQKRNPLSSVDWLDLVQRLSAAPGVGQLTVWQYENYGAVFPQIIAGMVGDEAAPLVTPRPKYVNRGLSENAVAHVMAIPDAPTEERTASAARKLYAVEDGNAPFDGFAPEEHAIGDASYARQLDAIVQMEEVRFLRPHSE